MNDLILVIITAIVVQAVVQQIKNLVKFHKGKWFKNIINLKVVVSMIASFLVCLAYNVDLLALLGFTSVVPYIGSVITAIVVSGGSTLIHELISQIKDARGEK